MKSYIHNYNAGSIYVQDSHSGESRQNNSINTYIGCLKSMFVILSTPFDCSSTWITPWDSIVFRNLDNWLETVLNEVA